MTREIPLTQNKLALVDDEDYDSLVRLGWYANRPGKSRTWYAARSENRKMILMHRVILHAPNGMWIDHINGNGLDNRRLNLRLSTHSQNQHNRRLQSDNTSGFKGVSFDKRCNKWRSQICLNGRNIHIGYFDDPQEAALAYDKRAREIFGEFARTNPQLGKNNHGLK